MTIKSFLLGISCLGMATVLAYCTKEQPTPTASQHNQAITERGICTVTIEPINCSIEVCGVQNSAVVCGANQFGTDYIKEGLSGTYVINTPAVLSAAIDLNAPIGAGAVVRVTSGAVTRDYPFLPSSSQDAVVADIKVGDLCDLQ